MRPRREAWAFLLFTVEDPIQDASISRINMAQVKSNINIGDRRRGMTQSLSNDLL